MTSESSLCKNILSLSEDIEVVISVSYPSGEVQAIASRIQRGDRTSRRHFALLATMMRDHIESFEEDYGKLNYFLFNFAKGQAMLFLTGKALIVVGTIPDADPKIITKVADRLKDV